MINYNEFKYWLIGGQASQAAPRSPQTEQGDGEAAVHDDQPDPDPRTEQREKAEKVHPPAQLHHADHPKQTRARLLLHGPQNEGELAEAAEGEGARNQAPLADAKRKNLYRAAE